MNLLDGIKPEDPNFIIAQALKLMTQSTNSASQSVNSKSDAIALDNHNLRAETAAYFDRTAAVEREVKILRDSNKRLQRAVSDANAAARAAEQEVSGY